MGTLWGPSKDLDYWTARHRNLISPEERRAMALLASITDEPRFSLYCQIGQMPAMGNATKRFYLIRRFERVLELEDGRPHQSWCIGTPDRYAIPETDHVTTMKTLIEGEELAFREIGNPSLLGGLPERGDGDVVRNPYKVSFLNDIDESWQRKENADFADFMDMKRVIEGMHREYGFKKRAWEQVIREGPPSLDDLMGIPKKTHLPPRISIGGILHDTPVGQFQQLALTHAGTNATATPTGAGFFINNSAGTITNPGIIQNCVFVGTGVQMGGA